MVILHVVEVLNQEYYGVFRGMIDPLSMPTTGHPPRARNCESA